MFLLDLRARLVRCAWCVLLLAASGRDAAQAGEADPPRIPWILADDFELGGLCAWSLAVGGDPGLPLCFLCGDGLLDLAGGEQCDDFNTDPGDGCSALCQVEICGNGETEEINGEQCDDGNGDDLDACRNNCQFPLCGDGVESTSEACDTGGNSANCDIDCTAPTCGDGLVNQQFIPTTAPGPEACDDGGGGSGDGCSPLCQFEFCGDGVPNAPNEQCDDGNGEDLDNCRNNCQSPLCGDGVESSSETCDTGGNTIFCDYDCTLPMCGNGDGIVNFAAGERCDDNNLTNGDGCNSCQFD